MTGKRASLSEVMGKAAANKAEGGGLRLEHLQELLGEGMPDLPKDAVGRHRLIRSLKNRFGNNFRSLPGVGELVKRFDDEIAMEHRISKLRAIKLKR